MSYQLVIAEKPSVARSIAGVIGADRKQDGYPTRKSSAISIPGFGNGAVHSGVVRNGTDLVCMDNPQTEKTISD